MDLNNSNNPFSEIYKRIQVVVDEEELDEIVMDAYRICDPQDYEKLLGQCVVTMVKKGYFQKALSYLELRHFNYYDKNMILMIIIEHPLRANRLGLAKRFFSVMDYDSVYCDSAREQLRSLQST
ncbi:MAG: hypothetical protein A3H01_01170 [Candidatus Wildermuthbacteria bacterium RIFCSPLOWO2_12_FULL_40_9]|uniref:Uncharacterized protein n=1 Tax=Candidatus Wildermuthbacteria bacterium RIFCSPLOWO2_12_FULL_40_9 TaxID=1802467 RepID=A0A1G2RUZ4_9BACT|nr:MAG: hypothetical protein A3H01_01170 [Candidatus Wildermuthbacteria bacterium RIFCSPLOWO2_12_FULL_40_9]